MTIRTIYKQREWLKLGDQIEASQLGDIISEKNILQNQPTGKDLQLEIISRANHQRIFEIKNLLTLCCLEWYEFDIQNDLDYCTLPRAEQLKKMWETSDIGSFRGDNKFSESFQIKALFFYYKYLKKLLRRPNFRIYVLKDNDEAVALQCATVGLEKGTITGVREFAYILPNYLKQMVENYQGKQLPSLVLYDLISDWFSECAVEQEKIVTGKNMLRHIKTYITYLGFIPKFIDENHIFLKKDRRNPVSKIDLHSIYNAYQETGTILPTKHERSAGLKKRIRKF